VDGFRFWLQDYEDLAKAEQYKRWRALTQAQEANDAKAQVPSH